MSGLPESNGTLREPAPAYWHEQEDLNFRLRFWRPTFYRLNYVRVLPPPALGDGIVHKFW